MLLFVCEKVCEWKNINKGKLFIIKRRRKLIKYLEITMQNIIII